MGAPGIIVFGDAENTVLKGTPGDDSFEGSNISETFYTGLGDDVLFAGDGDDYVFADLGNDWLSGGYGIDTIRFYFIGITWSAYAEEAVNFDLNKSKQDLGYFGIKSVYGFENVDATFHDDQVYGSATANRLSGLGGNDHLDGREGNDYINGGSDDDTLLGGSGDDVMIGATGADRFFSQPGADIISGGNDSSLFDDGARDTFIFSSTSYSPSSTTRDTIYGFFDGATGDKIDLSRIDANGSASGDGMFSFIGANTIGSTSTSQVQVRATEVDDQYLVRIDTDNDSSAEMQLLVYSTSVLTSADFIL